MHIPIYADLLSVKVTFFLRIATKSLSSILCDIEIGLDVHFKQSFFFYKLYIDSFFLTFPIVLPYTALFINLCNAFPSLSPLFSASILFCVLNSTYCFSHRDWLNSNGRRIFLVLILILSRVVSFYNEPHNFLYHKSQAPFF